MVGRLPESWIPPEHLLDLRARVRLRHTLVDAAPRVAAADAGGALSPRRPAAQLADDRRVARLARAAGACRRPRASRSRSRWRMIDAHDAQLAPLDQELRDYAKRQPGCRALMRHYGIGPLTSITILAELGDARRFSSSREAVRYAGLDITVHQSDARRAPGHLSRQGPPALRWALFEAAQCARRTELARPRLLPAGSRAARRQPRLPRGRAQAAQAQLPHPARTRRGGPRARMTSRSARAALTHADAPRPAPGMLLPPPPGGRPS